MKKGFTLTEVPMLKRTSGIKNEVLNSRESKTKEPLNKNKRFAAFTLTEVLITLIVIGAIALVTVPNLISDYHKRVQYDGFVKMYNTIKTAIGIAVTDHKQPNRWEFDSNDPSQTLKRYFYPYLKVKRICEEETIALCLSEYDIYLINNEKVGTSAAFPANGMAVILADGTLLYTILDAARDTSQGFVFLFDINGPKKPNTFGRDMFLLPYVLRHGKWYFAIDEYNVADCDPSNSNGTGWACAARLVRDGKMAY